MWQLDYKEGWGLKNWCFKLWCWRRLFSVPWTARGSNYSMLKEFNPEYSLEGLRLKLKLQYFGHDAKSWPTGKDPEAGKDWRPEEKVTTQDDTVGWHHPRLNAHEFEQDWGDGEGQGSLGCCSPWGCKESDMTERLPFHFIFQLHSLGQWKA